MTNGTATGKTGVLGGTFDPVHLGHAGIALGVQQALGLDRVDLVPSHQPPHRPNHLPVSAAHRFAMVALAASAHERLFASDREVRRGGVSYMLETLRGYAADEPGSAPVLILGLDAFAELATWREPQALVAAFDVAVVTRPGYDPALIERLPGWIRTRVQPLSREAARRDKAPHQCAPGPASREGPGRIVLVPLPPIPVSATEVRERIARGESLDGLVAPEIAAYIAKYRLYWRSTAEPTET